MKTDRRLASLLFAASVTSLTGCVSATPPPRPSVGALAGVKRLAIVVPPAPPLTVMQSRAEGAPAASMAGAAFGALGMLVAAGVTSAVQQSADEKRAEQVAPHVGQYQPRAVLLEALLETLRDALRFELVAASETAPTGPEAKAFDAVVTVEMKQWGLRLAPSRARDALTGFVELAARMVTTAEGRELWNEQPRIAGQRSRTIQEYGADAELLRRELTETLQAAGQRVAAELLYPRGDR